MKKYILIFMSVVLIGMGCFISDVHAVRAGLAQKRHTRKSKGLADYFNLNERADLEETTIVEAVPQEDLAEDGGVSVSEQIGQGQEEIELASAQDEKEAPEFERQNDTDQEQQDDTTVVAYDAEEVSHAQDEQPEEPDASEDTEAAEVSSDQDQDMEDIDEEPVDLPGPPLIHRGVADPVDTASDIYLKETSIDVEKKKDAAIALVNKASEYFDTHSAEEAFNKFSHTKDFVDAELYIFGYAHDGVCVAHPKNPELIWENLYDMKDSYGRHPVRGAIRKADEGGGWITYEWEGATKLTYCKEVKKDDKKYVLAAGFYSHSKRDSVVNLVKSAVVFFNDIIKRGFSPSIAFSAFSYPVGSFVQGDLYTYTIGFDGITYAHGDNPGLIGTSALDVQDAQGKYVNKEIIKALKNTTNDGVWVDYISKRAPKKVYAEKVQDKEGNEYFIACGYYPDADRQEVVDLVRKAYNYMKSNGKSIAARDFTDPKNDDFRYGDLYIFVYSTNGTCVAQGNNPALVGKNRLDLQDSDGRYYIREFINKAKEGGGWVNYKVNKLYRAVYVQLVDMGVDQYVIGSGLYPISKRETMVLMVKAAASYLESANTSEALREFVKQDSKFRRGDLSIFVLEDTGTCLAYGDEYELIWRNLMKVEDDNKNPFVRQMIETAKQGSGLIKYKLNNSPKISYIEPVHKNDKNYIVGSGYYL